MKSQRAEFNPDMAVTQYGEAFRLGGIMWNVEEIKGWIKDNPTEVEEMVFNPIELISHIGFTDIDKDYAMNTDTNKPVIFVEMLPGESALVDGNHRVWKGIATDLTQMKGYRLNFDQQLGFVTEKRMYDWLIEKAGENGHEDISSER